MTGDRFAIGLIQARAGSSPGENLARAVNNLREAARSGAQVVCLQELFRSQYFCQREDPALFDLAEPVPGPTTEALRRVAKEEAIVVIAPLFERRAAGVYHNSAAILDADGEMVGVYRKMHIPDDPGYYEKYYFTPGDLGFPAFETRFGRIACLICWDQWFPEGARLAAMAGASVIFYPTAIGWHPGEKSEFGETQRDAWRTVQRGHAVANGVYVAAPNRVGHEVPPEGGAGIEFWGSSFVADPQGQILAEASEAEEEILLAEVDPGRIEDVRRNWPFLRDRRVDAFGPLARRLIDREP